MRRRIYFFFILSGLIISISFFIKPVIISLVKSSLKKSFNASVVSIGNCSFRPLNSFSLTDLEIIREGAYGFKAKEVKVYYKLPALFRKDILRVFLRDSRITFYSPDIEILDLMRYTSVGKGNFLVRSLGLSNIDIELKLKDFALYAKVTSEIDLINEAIKSCDLAVEQLICRGIQLRKAFLKAGYSSLLGGLTIAELRYDKLKAEGINSGVRIDGRNLFFEPVSAGILDGEMQGAITVKTGKVIEYTGELKFTNLDMEKFVSEYKLNDKYEIKGKLSGVLSLKGKGADLDILSGNFSTLDAGGMLSIKDTAFLENMARNSGQSLDILIENFRDYYYNIGEMTLSLDKGDLNFDINLDGETGKRNLNVIIHSGNLNKKEGL